jgi:hypothetical protein
MIFFEFGKASKQEAARSHIKQGEKCSECLIKDFAFSFPTIAIHRHEDIFT